MYVSYTVYMEILTVVNIDGLLFTVCWRIKFWRLAIKFHYGSVTEHECWKVRTENGDYYYLLDTFRGRYQLVILYFSPGKQILIWWFELKTAKHQYFPHIHVQYMFWLHLLHNLCNSISVHVHVIIHVHNNVHNNVHIHVRLSESMVVLSM